MSKWYFSSKERQEALKKELEEWRGTPFRHRAGVKKVGADCIHFCIRVYELVGALHGAVKRIPYYGHDWCFHTDEEILYNAIKGSNYFEEIFNWETIMNGDLVLYKFGRATSHSAIYFDRNIYQAVNITGVHHMLYFDYQWSIRRRYLFRVKNNV